MRKIKEVLRLQALGLKQEQIARSCGISQSTVSEYQAAATAAGVHWDQVADWNELRIQQELFPNRKPAVRGPVNAATDFSTIHQQLQRHKHVTLQLLWEEYRQSSPDGYRYSRFCELYRRWRGRQDVVMRQQHRAGEKLFVDFAGDTVPVYVEGSEEARPASIFVAVLGASSYTYAEATWTQGLEDWIAAHVRTFEFLGGVPEIVIPDNTRAAVNKRCRYDPDLNRVRPQQDGTVEIRYGAQRIAQHLEAERKHQVMRQHEHHAGIPLGARQPAQTLLHLRETAPVVEVRSLAAYESAAAAGGAQ